MSRIFTELLNAVFGLFASKKKRPRALPRGADDPDIQFRVWAGRNNIDADAVLNALPPHDGPNQADIERDNARYMARERYRKSEPLNWHFAHAERLSSMPAAEAHDVALAMVSRSVEAAAMWRRAYPGDALPEHRGFVRLAVDDEKAGRFDEAIAWCARAQAEGWAGDWDKRIERCRNKAAKAAKPKD